jgi:hypothetical protein
MKAAHHPSLFASRAASDVPVTKYKRGQVVSVEVVAAGTLETAKTDITPKRGPKPKKPDAAKFAETGAYQWREE